MTDTHADTDANEGEILAAFREYFYSCMNGSFDELVCRVGLPFFDIRDGELTQMRSESQLEGFRRGLRARMATLGVVTSELKAARLLMNRDGLALLQFESIRQDANSLSRGNMQCLAFMRRDGSAPWRVWMISVLRSL